MGNLTQSWIEKLIAKHETGKIGEKTTVVLVTLTNGFEIVGSSSCVNPEEFDLDVGERIALERIKEKIWELEGYREQLSQWAIEDLKKRYPAQAVRVEAGECQGCDEEDAENEAADFGFTLEAEDLPEHFTDPVAVQVFKRSNGMHYVAAFYMGEMILSYYLPEGPRGSTEDRDDLLRRLDQLTL